MNLGDSKGYPLQKFIEGVVTKLIGSYRMTDFKFESPSGQIDSDFRAELIQNAWVAALEAQQSHPKECKNPAYVRRSIVNALLKVEQRDRPRRDLVSNCIDEPASLPLAVEAKDLLPQYDLELIIKKARLTPSEKIVIELFYGLDGEGERSIRKIATMMGKTLLFVQQRLSTAKIKLSVASEKYAHSTSNNRQVDPK